MGCLPFSHGEQPTIVPFDRQTLRSWSHRLIESTVLLFLNATLLFEAYPVQGQISLRLYIERPEVNSFQLLGRRRGLAIN